MQFNTIIKLGSLAFGVAQDEKVRELATMIHKGARRRGAFAPWQGPTSGSPNAPVAIAEPSAPLPAQAGQSSNAVIPFAPQKSISYPANATSGSLPSSASKYLTVDNAKKALQVAGQVANLLIK